MPALSKKESSKYSVEQLYNVVADVERYPEFLPWCVGLRVIERKENELTAEMVVNFKIFTEKFKTRVKLLPPQSDYAEIKVELVEGPLSHLNNEWRFYKENGQTMIDFSIDFAMKSHLMEKMVGMIFEPAVNKLSKAFDERAGQIYKKL